MSNIVWFYFHEKKKKRKKTDNQPSLFSHHRNVVGSRKQQVRGDLDIRDHSSHTGSPSSHLLHVCLPLQVEVPHVHDRIPETMAPTPSQRTTATRQGKGATRATILMMI